MKIGLHFELQNPPKWPQNPSHLYGFTLEACQEAERLGVSSAWFSEHHLDAGDRLPSPLTFAAAVAARTRRIRLGAVVTAALHHPVEIAEQSAVVDVLSDGRVDLGISVGDGATEFGLFDVPMDADTDTCVRRLRALWDRQGIGPGPVQDRLPIWLEYAGQQGAHRAGLLGEQLLSADAALWAPYREGLAETGHPPDTGVMAGRVQAWATEDPERDWPSVSAYLAQQSNTFQRQRTGAGGQTESGSSDVGPVVNATGTGPFESFIFGTPEFVVGAIRAGTAGAPVDTVVLLATIGGMDDMMVIRNIDLICERLVPLLDASVAVGT